MPSLVKIPTFLPLVLVGPKSVIIIHPGNFAPGRKTPPTGWRSTVDLTEGYRISRSG